MYLEVLLLLVFQIAVHRQVQITEEEREEDMAGRARATEKSVKEEPKRYERCFFSEHRSYNLFLPHKRMLCFRFTIATSKSRNLILYYLRSTPIVYHVLSYKHYTSRLSAGFATAYSRVQFYYAKSNS